MALSGLNKKEMAEKYGEKQVSHLAPKLRRAATKINRP